jgi:predicted dehydrogenase
MNDKKRLGMGLVGPGFVAAHHLDAVRRLGDVELVAVDVIHNTTPNHLHFAVTMAALRAGKHVVSDKPLAMSVDEARRLRDAAVEAGVAHVVTFNYRGNPLVQQAREMILRHEIGRLTFIHGQYLQDWLTDPNVYSWRSDPAKGGATSALGDIGSHWCDLAEHVSGVRIAAVLADLTTVVPVRYSRGASSEAFTATSGDGLAHEMRSEDLATAPARRSAGSRSGRTSCGWDTPPGRAKF